MIVIRVISEGYTIDSRRTMKAFKTFIVKALKRRYPEYLGYEIA